MFSLYFILGATAFIFLFGAVVWGLRSVSRPPATPVPTATATVETFERPPLPAVADTPLPNFTPPPTAALVAPAALQAGPFAESSPITATVADVNNVPVPPKLPAQIPQPRLDLSATEFDLGAGTPGQIVTRELALANPGARELVIRQLILDCTCLQARVEAARLPTGSRTRLLLAYDAATDDAGSGRINHKLVLVTTDGQRPLVPVDIFVTLP